MEELAAEFEDYLVAAGRGVDGCEGGDGGECGEDLGPPLGGLGGERGVPEADAGDQRSLKEEISKHC